MPQSRVILDTNLLISFLISKQLTELEQALEKGQIILVFSEELFRELLTVINRPKFKKYFNKYDLENLLSIIADYLLIFEVKSSLNISRDKKDNFLLNLAVDAHANYLVTGDKDLLTLEMVGSTKIITYRQFREALNLEIN